MNTNDNLNIEQIGSFHIRPSDVASLVVQENVMSRLSVIELQKIHSAVGFELLDRTEGKSHD